MLLLEGVNANASQKTPKINTLMCRLFKINLKNGIFFAGKNSRMCYIISMFYPQAAVKEPIRAALGKRKPLTELTRERQRGQFKSVSETYL